MDSQKQQIDPNSNAEAYRNLTPADHPPIQDKQLEVVIVYRDDSLILGASNMVDRYWNGTIWYHKDVANFDRNQHTAAIRTESGVRVASYLGKHDRFVIGEDSGLLQIFEIVLNSATNLQELQCMGFSCQHDDSITSICKFENNDLIVSAGLDSGIKIWDVRDITVTSSFPQAHTDAITCVEVQPSSNSTFISTSFDSEAILWDTRKSKPALGLWEKPHCPLTAASWKPNDENIIAIGAIDGSISMHDLRNIGIPFHESIQFPREVHKLLFNPDNPNQLAGCCDSVEVKVFDVAHNCENIYESDTHTDFVRGLTWHKNVLITCSWDNTVLRHTLAFKSNS